MITISQLPLTYSRARVLFVERARRDPMKRKRELSATRKHAEDQQYEDGAMNPNAFKPDAFFEVMAQKLRELDAKITGLSEEVRELRQRERKRK